MVKHWTMIAAYDEIDAEKYLLLLEALGCQRDPESRSKWRGLDWTIEWPFRIGSLRVKTMIYTPKLQRMILPEFNPHPSSQKALKNWVEHDVEMRLIPGAKRVYL